MAFVLQPSVVADAVTLRAQNGVLSVKPGGVTFRKPFVSVMNNQVSTGNVPFVPPIGYMAEDLTLSATDTEDEACMVFTEAGTLKNFRLRVNGLVAATTTVTVEFRFNGGTIITFTYADTDAVGTVKTSATTQAVVAGDRAAVKVSHNNGANRMVSYTLAFDEEVATL